MNAAARPSRKFVRCLQSALLALTCVLIVGASNAQTPEAVCAKLLPPAKLTAAAGAGMKSIGAEASTGYTQCSWMRSDQGRDGMMRETMVVAKHFHKPSQSTGMDASNVDEWLKIVVDAYGSDTKDTRQSVPGLGKRAGIASRDAKFVVAVELPDGGMKRIETSYLTKEQALALAKAVTTP